MNNDNASLPIDGPQALYETNQPSPPNVDVLEEESGLMNNDATINPNLDYQNGHPTIEPATREEGHVEVETRFFPCNAGQPFRDCRVLLRPQRNYTCGT